jgi:deoxycytidylate deaminase
MGDQTELVIGLVAAAGTDLGRVTDELRTELHEYGYSVDVVRLSDYLQDLPWAADFKDKPEDERMWLAMDAGTRLRTETDHGDALALWAISDIVAARERESTARVQDGQEEHPANLDRKAWILRSLKTPEEVATLRAVYGPRFVLVAAYSPEQRRNEDLGEQIRRSRGTKNRDEWMHQPEELIQRDRDEDLGKGQDVEGTFHQADFFVDASAPAALRDDVVRSLEILFGHPFRTPTRHEFAQFQARGAALRSAEPGRQVGAAIATPEGSVVALGTNEVPKAGGGSHWEEDGEGNREFEIAEIETNRREQDEMAGKLAEMLRAELSVVLERSRLDRGSEILEAFGAGLEEALLDGSLRDLTEFGRAVHAEMDALLDAARRGIAVRDCTLHTTTFPCHNCARHIIAAGIAKVIFIEPYSKSRALDLHSQDLDVDGAPTPQGEPVRFEPFRGVAPRLYPQLFDMRARARAGQPRKDVDGRISKQFDKKHARPVFADLEPAPFRAELPAYRRRELLALASFERFSEQLTAGEIVPTEPGGNNDDDENEMPVGR